MYLLKYGIYVFVILLVIHSILYYYNIDLFELVIKQKTEQLEDNINIEENIKDLQHSLKELENLS
jgi:hypothetical protein